jgi:type II secretory pathway pseudopilin PulG
LELMIAIGVLGIGLIMVAAIFPVALDQHRRTTDETLASDAARRAQAAILAKGLNAGTNQPFCYAVPFNNEPDPTAFRTYIAGLNQPGSVTTVFDLPDVLYPYDPDSIVRDLRPCYVWLAFVRPTQGVQQYTVFVCKRAPAQRFALQEMTARQKGDLDLEPSASDVEYPAPWNIPVEVRNVPPDRGFQFVGKIEKGKNNQDKLTFSQLIRPASKLLSQSTGRLYTVITARDTDYTITTLEEPSGEPTAPNLWVIPGPVSPLQRASDEPATFGRSPIIDILTFAGPS